MRIIRAVLLLTLLVTTGLTPSAAGSELVQWLPAESYAGGKQADPRLDQPVQLWRAGVTLAELFVDLSRQTGVALRFSRGEAEDPRVRVSVFLNPTQPPTLRDLLVQLSWTVDCPFAVSRDEGQPAYVLLSTTVGAGADEAIAGRKETWQRTLRQRHQLLDAAFEEYRKALALSREEAIRKYRDQDHLLLLNLLDPQRRAVVQFVCAHAARVAWTHAFEDPEAEGNNPQEDGMGWEVSWGARGGGGAGSGVAVGPGPVPEGLAEVGTAFGLGDRAGEVGVSFRTTKDGRLYARVSLVEQRVGPNGRPERTDTPITELTLADVGDGFLPSARDEVALLRALGEVSTPQQERVALARARAARTAQVRQREQVGREGSRVLSPGAAEKLSSRAVPLDAPAGDEVWRLQERVAKATGYHVVADALSSGGAAPALAGVSSQSALETLERFTTERRSSSYWRSPSWEWGDAGSFLRFRSANRDIWRAALPPQSYLDWVDARIAPYLPAPDAPPAAIDFALPIDPADWLRQHGRLTELQRAHGRELCYVEPRGPFREAVRQAAVRTFLGWPGLQSRFLPFLITLSESQWGQLRTAGLTAADFSPEQSEKLVQAARFRYQGPVLQQARWRLLPTGGDARWDGDPLTGLPRLELTDGGGIIDGRRLWSLEPAVAPTALRVHVEVAASQER